MLQVELRPPSADDNQRWSLPPVASLQREIEVPEAPGGRTDDPLDLGRIELTPN